MADDQIVQDEGVQAGTSEVDGTSTTAPDPIKELEARLRNEFNSKLEEKDRHWQSVKDREVKAVSQEAAKHRKRAEDRDLILESMRNDPVVKQRLPYYENMAAANAYRAQQNQSGEEEAKREFFEITKERLGDMGIDLNDGRIDWAEDATDIRRANDRILKSAAKIIKEDKGKLEENILKRVREEMKDSEANLRREAGIDSVDNTTSGGYGTGSLKSVLGGAKNAREAKQRLDEFIKGV